MLLWPFNKYPGTDYETFNWEWILKTVKEWVATMQTFKNSITAAWEAMQEAWDDFKDHVYKDEIEEILAKHPEWTTTVQDGAITFQKLNGSIRAFTTPEAFGAVGDGVTDDTAAWQAAVDLGLPVKATKNKYKTGSINVTKNIDIDCNNAEFILTGDNLFTISGTVTDTITGPGYTRNGTYSMTNPDYANYNGLAMLKGVNNFEEARTTYLGGFIANFENGHIVNTMPIDVVNPMIDIIEPVKGSLSNIGKITSNSSSNTPVIVVSYGDNYSLENISAETTRYIVIELENCYQCHVDKCNIKNKYGSTNTNSYVIHISNGIYNTIEHSTLYNKYWHAISTGGIYLNYGTITQSCIALCETTFAYSEHENTLGSIIDNCVIAGVIISGLCNVTNTTIKTILNSTNKQTYLGFSAVTIRDNAVYSAENIYLDVASNGIQNYTGVFMFTAAQVTGIVREFKKVTLRNVYKTQNIVGLLDYHISSGNYTVNGADITVDNINLEIRAMSHGNTNINTTGTTMSINNIQTRNETRYPGVGMSGSSFDGDMNITNSTLATITGTIYNLDLNHVKTVQNISALTVSNRLSGTGIGSVIADAVLLAAAELAITDMRLNPTITRFNISRDASGVYYQRWYAGTMTTYQIQ